MLLANTSLDVASMGTAAIARAAAFLRDGGIVAVPTESVYGLAVCADNAQAVAALRALKGRDAHKPMPLVAADRAMVAEHFAPPGQAFLQLMQHCWPGPLTLGLTPLAPWPDGVVSPLGTAGVRVSAHPVLQALTRATAGLITATSANFCGEAAATCRADAPAALAARVLWLDAGPQPGGAPSTVLLPCADGRVRVARSGAVSKATLEKLLGGHVLC